MAKRKPVVFTAKHRKELAVQLGARDYADVVESALAMLKRGVHLQMYPSRHKFVNIICSENVKPALTECMMNMIDLYIQMYRSCMSGKKFAMFEQQWFMHIEQYFSESTSQSRSPSSLWATVVERANMFSAHIPANEQRIVLATLAFHIHDLVVDQVKEYKRSIDTTASDKVRSDDTPVATFYESSTSLLRYGGFALHAMIKKRKKEVSTLKSHLKSECQLLESMKAKEDEHEQIPSAIHHLQQGGLTIVTPKMLPLLHEVLRKTASLVNETSCKEYGKNMLQVAKTEFSSEATTTAFFKLFTEC